MDRMQQTGDQSSERKRERESELEASPEFDAVGVWTDHLRPPSGEEVPSPDEYFHEQSSLYRATLGSRATAGPAFSSSAMRSSIPIGDSGLRRRPC